MQTKAYLILMLSFPLLGSEPPKEETKPAQDYAQQSDMEYAGRMLTWGAVGCMVPAVYMINTEWGKQAAKMWADSAPRYFAAPNSAPNIPFINTKK